MKEPQTTNYLTGKEDEVARAWMTQAALVAQHALCTLAHCGAVIVKDDVVIGRGYNAPPKDSEDARMCTADRSKGEDKYDRTCCVHAEWRAIMDTLRTHPNEIANSTLYFTRVDAKGGVVKSGKPFCTVCSRLALDVGIAKFALWHEEGIVEYPTDEYNALSYNYTPE